MKKVRVWLISFLLILPCFVFGCTSLYKGKDDTVLTTLNTTTLSTTSESYSTTQATTILTTVDTTVPNATSASHTTTPQTTSRKTTRGPCGGSVAHKEFKSVEELFDWIHNGEGIASLFRRAIQGLKLDHLLIIEAADEVFTLEYVRTFQRGSGWNAQVEYYFISEKGEQVCLYVHLKDMHAPVDDIKKYVKSSNLDNENLKHFKFSYKDITMPTTTNAATITSAASSGENDKEDTVAINVGEYFAASGRRMVDLKDVSRDEFLKKYPIILPGNFTTVDFYYEIPTEDGLRFNEVEGGYVRCESNDGRSNLYVYVCDTKYIGHSCIWNRNVEPKKSRINNVDVIISQQEKGIYRGQFEKNGYYYTFETSNMAQQDVVSALKDLTGG